MKKVRSWIQIDGTPLPDSDLRKVATSWSQVEWEVYLRWYTSCQAHRLLPPATYDALCEARSLDVFQDFGPVYHDWDRELCRRLLSRLPRLEALVLQFYFLEELTEREVASRIARSPGHVHRLKKQAISRLRQGQCGDLGSTEPLVRGLSSDESSLDEPSPWDHVLSKPIREDRMYDPDNWKEELRCVKSRPLRKALRELTPAQSQIIYLRFWCDFPYADIARRLKIGVNAVDEICSATLFRLKTRIVQELSLNSTGDSQCA